jgi:hypothetical protein
MVLRIIDYQFSLLVGPVGMWAKASISPLFELARETGEAEPVGAADRPHIHRPFLPIVPWRDQGFWVMIRGELAIRRGTSRHTLVFGGFHADPNHDAVMRIGGKAPRRQAHSLRRRASHACLGSPPPRTIMGIAP